MTPSFGDRPLVDDRYLGDGGTPRANCFRSGVYAGPAVDLGGPFVRVAHSYAPGQCSVVDGLVVLPSARGHVVAYRGNDQGPILWQQQTGMESFLMAAPVCFEGLAFIAGEPYKASNGIETPITAIESDGGRQRWVSSTPHAFSRPRCCAHGAVYTTGSGSAESSVGVAAIEADLGRVRWQREFPNRFEYGALACEGRYVAIGFFDNAAQDSSTGLPNYMRTAPHFGDLYFLDGMSGDVTFHAADIAVHQIAASDGLFIVDAALREPWFRGLLAFEADSGRLMWHSPHRPIQSQPLFIAPACLVVGSASVWCASLGLRCVNRNTGAERWSTDWSNVIDIAMTGERLLALRADGSLTEVDPQTGGVTREVHLGRRIDNFVAVDSGLLYMDSTDDSAIYSLGTLRR